MKKVLSIVIAFTVANFSMLAQTVQPAQGGSIINSTTGNCVTADQRAAINQMLERNIEHLKQTGERDFFPQLRSAAVAFVWPLRKTSGLSFNSYYAVNNFVDQNLGSGLLDYHCDARTYNGHRGIDIDTWPFPWYMYQNNLVEVIAGAAGTIIGKVDGNEDNHCSCSGDWNAVFIQHADGSRAWYGHLKKNSLTIKTIGQSVSAGEYLGVVASSGCSTQPHLHFEVYDGANNLIDPYSGSCNSLNSASWWAVQPANREPTLNALLTHNAVPVHGCPEGNEQPNISNVFTPGQTVYMATYYHDQLIGDISNLKIRKPDNTIWQSWSHTSNNTYTKSWWYWSWNLPVNGPFGTWKFEVEYKGQTFQHSFQYVAPSASVSLAVKVLLQGSLWGSASPGLMRDGLRSGGHLPLNDPYTYSGKSRFAHAGAGAASNTSAAILNANAGTANAIVDWVFVELRNATNPTTVVETRVALLQRDGDVVNPVDGLSPLLINGLSESAYYIAVKHRNHLGVMTAAPVSVAGTNTVVDFTTMAAADVYNNPGFDGYEMVTVGTANALWAGNVNADDRVKYQGSNADIGVLLAEVLNHSGNSSKIYNYDGANGYWYGDLTMDGKVKYQGSGSDIGYLLANVLAYGSNILDLYNFAVFQEQMP